ncbi:MAG TPA: EfeM/EfeO family lipoprotein [Mycobacteriales bacterium]|nr:EfeM/EfeO family lipoprotein [Mycobacteriales bacterium]
MLAGAVVVIVVGTSAAVIATRASAGRAVATRAVAIDVSPTACAVAWRGAKSGRSEYRVTDVGDSPEEVSIVGPDHLTTYAELEMVAPRTTQTMVAILPPGRYSWGCEADDGAESYSDLRAVTGPPVSGATPYIPVDADQLAGAVVRYRASVTAGLRVLVRDTDRLLQVARSGSRPAVERAWLTAHLDYERLGAAYDTFGSLEQRIDGRPNGLTDGVRSPRFAGFLRLEYALWHGQPRSVVVATATALDRSVRTLERRFPRLSTDPNDIALRAHEILENTLQFELTGEADQGSHTTLATGAANVAGTQLTLASLAPLLRKVDPALLRQLTAGLHRLAVTFAGFRVGPGRWLPLDDLGRMRRERLDAQVGGLLEQLSVLPDHLEILTTQDNQN